MCAQPQILGFVIFGFGSGILRRCRVKRPKASSVLSRRSLYLASTLSSYLHESIYKASPGKCGPAAAFRPPLGRSEFTCLALCPSRPPPSTDSGPFLTQPGLDACTKGQFCSPWRAVSITWPACKRLTLFIHHSNLLTSIYLLSPIIMSPDPAEC